MSLFGFDGPRARTNGARLASRADAARCSIGSDAFPCRWAYLPLRHCSGVASYMSHMVCLNCSGFWTMVTKLQFSKSVQSSPSCLSVHHSSPPILGRGSRPWRMAQLFEPSVLLNLSTLSVQENS